MSAHDRVVVAAAAIVRPRRRRADAQVQPSSWSPSVGARLGLRRDGPRRNVSTEPGDPRSLHEGRYAERAACQAPAPIAPVGLETVWPRRFSGRRRRCSATRPTRPCRRSGTGVTPALGPRGPGRTNGGHRLPTRYLVSGAAPVPSPSVRSPSCCTPAASSSTTSGRRDERRGGPVAHAVYGLRRRSTPRRRLLPGAGAAARHAAGGPRLRALDMLAEELFAAHLGRG